MKEYNINENGEDEDIKESDISEQYPYVDKDGRVYDNLIYLYSKEGKKLICEETGEIYDGVITNYPPRYHYWIYDEQDISGTEDVRGDNEQEGVEVPNE